AAAARDRRAADTAHGGRHRDAEAAHAAAETASPLGDEPALPRAGRPHGIVAAEAVVAEGELVATAAGDRAGERRDEQRRAQDERTMRSHEGKVRPSMRDLKEPRNGPRHPRARA